MLGKWAASTFKLPRPPFRHTVSRVLASVECNDGRNPRRKADQPVQCPQLETEVLQWVRKCEEWQAPIVTGATVRGKASKIRDEIVQGASPSVVASLSSMTFSNGWLCKFQQQHTLVSKHISGEATSVKTAIVKEGRVVH